MNTNTISIQNASKSFGQHKVLDNINLNCEKGFIYGIVGYNGSGKTVLFKSICGFLISKGTFSNYAPVLWLDISQIGQLFYGIKRFPDLKYILLSFLLMISVSALAVIWAIRSRDLEWINED